MADIDEVIRRAIAKGQVREVGPLTEPRSYGVYRLPSAGATRRIRYGNYPVRMWELEREFGSCALVHLLLSRSDARAVAALLNGDRV